MLSPDQAFLSEEFMKDLEKTKKEGSAQNKVNQFLRDYVTISFKNGHSNFTKKFITDKANQGFTWTTSEGVIVHPSSDNLQKAIDNINADQTFPYRIDKNGKRAINGYIIVDKEAEKKAQEEKKAQQENQNSQTENENTTDNKKRGSKSRKTGNKRTSNK